jgi:hypothetical protein
MKHVAEGIRIRSYVLVALPIGSKNIVKSTKELQNRSTDAFKELDNLPITPASPNTNVVPTPEKVISRSNAIEKSSGSQINALQAENKSMANNAAEVKSDLNFVKPVKSLQEGEVVVKDIDGKDKTTTLLKTENSEYAIKRNEALKKLEQLLVKF